MNNKKVALIGNPNVGKSSIFNYLTNLNQHTGNWTGKTVESAVGTYKYNNCYTIVDLPGTYSLFSSSFEEKVSRDYVCFNKYDLIVIVIDATMLKRNLNLALQILEINKNTILCVNLMDEAKKLGIQFDLNKLSSILKVPVIATSINDKKSLKKLTNQIDKSLENKNINNNIIKYNEKIENVINKLNITITKYTNIKINRFLLISLLNDDKHFNNKIYEYLNINKKNIKEINNVINICKNYLATNKILDYEEEIIKTINYTNDKIFNVIIKKEKQKNIKVDKILSSKLFGIPIMLLFFIFILWITITFANYPSKLLSNLLFSINNYISKFLIFIKVPEVIRQVLIDGILKTLSWVISVMLPPMAIFFPLFTLLEEIGFLPKIAFNLDKLFNKANCHGKQSLTMCMGLGCNSCGVTGCRIIESKKDRIIAILTNSFIPCNGRFPSLIAIITMFLATGYFSSFKASIILMFIIIIAIFITLIISKLLSKIIYKNEESTFILEIPPFRKPNIKKVIVRSIFDKTLNILNRAICVAAPFGLIIWLCANIKVGNISILKHCTNILDPIGNIFGVDGTILMALILGFPANEIVIPIIIMSYMNTSSLTDYNNLLELKNLLINNGWNTITSICSLFLILFHFPCSTTILTIKKETNSKILTFIAFLLPTITGLLICFIINTLYNLF